MPTDNRTFWWCGGKDGVGHVVGELGEIEIESGKVTGLFLYQESIWTPPKIMPPLRMRLIGTALDIKCTQCQCKFNWYIGQGALIKLSECIKNA
jgi:hypothetical protein